LSHVKNADLSVAQVCATRRPVNIRHYGERGASRTIFSPHPRSVIYSWYRILSRVMTLPVGLLESTVCFLWICCRSEIWF